MQQFHVFESHADSQPDSSALKQFVVTSQPPKFVCRFNVFWKKSFVLIYDDALNQHEERQDGSS